MLIQNIIWCLPCTMFSSFLIPLILLFAYYYYTKHGKKLRKYNMPNGPSQISVYGNLFQIISKPHLQFSKWTKQYGKIYTVSIFGTPALIVNDAKTMKQVFSSSESTGKLGIPLDELSKGKYGVLASEGAVWQEIRMFTMKTLRDCGISKGTVVEPAVWHACQPIMDWFDNTSKNSAVVFPLREKFIDCIGNVIWNIASRGGKYSKKSEMGKLVAKVIDSVQITTNSGLMFLPWLKHVAPEWSGYNGLIQACLALDAKVDKYFEERKKYRKVVTVEPEDRNLLDAYLDQWENCTEEKSCFYGETGWKHCFASLVQFVLAGGETTATMLNWIVNFLVACPSVQQKLFEEVNEALGNERPGLKEAKRLPYLESVIYEALRMSKLSPFGAIHRLLDSVKLEDYWLPKGILLIANIYHCHSDKSIWGDPENFRPERFLEVTESEKIQLKQRVVVFQAGKRICPGEGIAKDVLFLMTTRLVQKFQFLPVSDKSPREYIEADSGYLLIPKQIGVRVIARV